MDIIICNNCGGSGEKSIYVGSRYSEYDIQQCSTCNGTGRLKTRTYTYNVPFDTNNAGINKIDEEIIKLIRKIKIIYG